MCVTFLSWLLIQWHAVFSSDTIGFLYNQVRVSSLLKYKSDAF